MFGGHPEWHIQVDALEIINGYCTFRTMNGRGTAHIFFGTWDMIIAHPPCTYLAASSAVRLFNKDHSIKDAARYEKALEAKRFFEAFLNADCPRIAVENPRMLRRFRPRDPDQEIEPYYFGDPWKKLTCLWLKGLPPLKATNMVEPKGLWVGSTSGRRDASVYCRYALKSNRSQKTRSKTFPGIARAMAEQWGGRV